MRTVSTKSPNPLAPLTSRSAQSLLGNWFTQGFRIVCAGIVFAIFLSCSSAPKAADSAAPAPESQPAPDAAAGADETPAPDAAPAPAPSTPAAAPAAPTAQGGPTQADYEKMFSDSDWLLQTLYLAGKRIDVNRSILAGYGKVYGDAYSLHIADNTFSGKGFPNRFLKVPVNFIDGTNRFEVTAPIAATLMAPVNLPETQIPESQYFDLIKNAHTWNLSSTPQGLTLEIQSKTSDGQEATMSFIAIEETAPAPAAQ